MKKNLTTVILASLIIWSQSVHSQQLVPATSEDEEMFDQQLQQAAQAANRPQPKLAPGDLKKDSNFKNFVVTEAKKLKDSDVEVRNQMGQLIANQKRKNQAAQGQAETGGSSVNSDGRNSAPNLNNAGGSSDSPGNSGNRRKK